jgi:hypothetical protein
MDSDIVSSSIDRSQTAMPGNKFPTSKIEFSSV